MRFLFFLIFFFFSHSLLAQDDLQVVPEHVDHITLVYVTEGYPEEVILFFRNDRLLAYRRVREDMIWYYEEGKFVLHWRDYGYVNRTVTADSFLYMGYPVFPINHSGPWWAQWKNMTDLKKPK